MPSELTAARLIEILSTSPQRVGRAALWVYTWLLFGLSTGFLLVAWLLDWASLALLRVAEFFAERMGKTAD